MPAPTYTKRKGHVPIFEKIPRSVLPAEISIHLFRLRKSTNRRHHNLEKYNPHVFTLIWYYSTLVSSGIYRCALVTSYTSSARLPPPRPPPPFLRHSQRRGTTKTKLTLSYETEPNLMTRSICQKNCSILPGPLRRQCTPWMCHSRDKNVFSLGPPAPSPASG